MLFSLSSDFTCSSFICATPEFKAEYQQPNIAIFRTKRTGYKGKDRTAKTYSEDLQIRVVRAYEGELGSIREIAKQFQVGKTFVNALVQQWRKTGSSSPLRHAGGVKTKLDAEHLQKLQQIVEITK